MRNFTILLLLTILMLFSISLPALSRSAPPPMTVDQATAHVMGADLQAVLLRAAHDPQLQIAQASPITTVIGDVLAVPSPDYLVICGGLTTDGKTISQGGKLLTIPLDAVADTALTNLFNFISPGSNGVLSVSGDLTLPTYKINFYLFVIKGKAAQYHVLAQASIMTAEQISALKSSMAFKI